MARVWDFEFSADKDDNNLEDGTPGQCENSI